MPLVQAQDFVLPKPGVMVHLSPPMNPPILKSIKVHTDNPFRFDFILDRGDDVIPALPAGRQGNAGIHNKGNSDMDPRFRGDDSGGIKFHLDPAMLEQLQDAPGFVPVIINIQPMTDLRSFLGLTADAKTLVSA